MSHQFEDPTNLCLGNLSPINMFLDFIANLHKPASHSHLAFLALTSEDGDSHDPGARCWWGDWHGEPWKFTSRNARAICLASEIAGVFWYPGDLAEYFIIVHFESIDING